jgi:hypothetical protein
MENCTAMTRYTITGEGASPGCFRLVEDRKGAWMQAAGVDALLKEIGLACNREHRRSADSDEFVAEIRRLLAPVSA